MKSFMLMMIITIVFFKFIRSYDTNGTDCKGVHVQGKLYKKHVLAKGLNRPYQLSSYKKGHKIFFSFNIGKDNEDEFQIAYLEEGKVGHKVIEEVVNGFATAVDEENDFVYFGGSEGVYKQALNQNSTEVNHIIKHHNIWDLFFKEELYFIDYPLQRLYRYSAPKIRASHEHLMDIHDEVYQFVIDGEGEKFYTNNTGLYGIVNGTEHIKYSGETVFRTIELNSKGEAYFGGKHDIYIANKRNHTLEKIAHIRNLFGLTFDPNDFMVYSDPHEIVKLIPGECDKH